MKLTAPLLFASTALAGSSILSKRALTDIAKTMIADLENIRNQTMAVTNVIMGFNGASINDALPINTATAQVIAAINNATMDARANPQNLTDAGSQALGPYTQELAYAANKSIAALIQKKPEFEKLSLTPLVVQSLQQQINASTVFGGVLIPKIPADTRPVATALNSQVLLSLQMGVECFQKNMSCNPNPVNASRTLDSAIEDGALSAAGRTVQGVSAVVVLGVAFAAGLAF